jgi:hypothetical protein
MAGQSPYAVNSGVNYNNIDSGLAAGLFYNVEGLALSIAGIGLYPDIYVTKKLAIARRLLLISGYRTCLTAKLRVTSNYSMQKNRCTTDLTRAFR